MPVRAFPRIWIAAGHLPEESAVASALAEHLARDANVKVRQVDVQDLEPARKAGRIPPATGVVLLDLRLHEDTRTEWATRPETVCGPYGCYTDEQSYVYDVPVVRGTLKITVYDGPTARVLQTTSIRASDEGRPFPVLRDRVATKLADHLGRLVDQRSEPVRIVLLYVKLAGVDEAIDAARHGDWHAARVRLERALSTAGAEALPSDQQARLWYDVGQARRFDATTMNDPERHFDEAEQALRRALSLHATDLYRTSLADLRRHREQVRVVVAQREAAARNARMAASRQGDAGIPEPPPSYK